MIRLGILGSTRGTNLDAIVSAIANKHIAANIEVVISNKSTAPILERAKSYGLNTEFINPIGLEREVFDAQISELLKRNTVDLIVLIGYMRILSSAFISDWQGKIINVHPSLLPAHAGKMDLSVHSAVLAAGEKETGCTVHIVTEEVDAGPILLQKTCHVLSHDTPEDLKERVQKLEGMALVEAIELVRGQVSR